MTTALSRAITIAAFCAGCTAEVSAGPPPPPPPPDGTLTLEWTINGTTDPNQCAQGSAASLHLSVQASDGTPVGELDAPCEAFALTAALAPDRYTGQATLTGPGGAPRTTTIELVPVTILSGSDLTVPLAFSASSFLARYR